MKKAPTLEELKILLAPLIEAGRDIQAEVGGPDRDYERAAVKDADLMLNRIARQIQKLYK